MKLDERRKHSTISAFHIVSVTQVKPVAMHTFATLLMVYLSSLSLASSYITRPTALASSLPQSHLSSNRVADLIQLSLHRDDEVFNDGDEIVDEEAYKELQRQREARARVISGLQKTKPSDTDDIAAKFVPAFVG